MFNSCAVAVRERGEQFELVIELGWSDKVDMHRFDDQHEPGFLERSIRNPEGTQHLHSTPFEIVQILRVVYPALAIGFAVVNTERDSMGVVSLIILWSDHHAAFFCDLPWVAMRL